MCTYSFIADHFIRDFERYRQPQQPQWVWPNEAARIAELERKVASLEELLRAAQKYDTDNNEPHCELENKKDMLRKLAKELGVEITLP